MAVSSYHLAGMGESPGPAADPTGHPVIRPVWAGSGCRVWDGPRGLRTEGKLTAFCAGSSGVLDPGARVAHARPVWPRHFPACCPLDDAVSTTGDFYYVAHHPVTDDDLLSALERGVFLKIDPCQRASLSFWKCASGAAKVRVLDDRDRASRRVTVKPVRQKIIGSAETGLSAPDNMCVFRRADHRIFCG